MSQVFHDENQSCELDVSKAVWATDQLNTIFHAAKLHILSDVDFVMETEEDILFVEYKNANLPQASHPESFRPMEDRKLNTVARKYMDSHHFLRMWRKPISKKKRFVYILECVKGDIALRKRVRNLLVARLPFLLQKQMSLSEPIIDSLDVLSIDEWNQRYESFPLQLL